MPKPPADPNSVAGWAADHSGCGYYRVGLPLQQLSLQGYKTSTSTAMENRYFDSRVVVGQRIAKIGPSILWRHLINRGKNLTVYEIDDDLFNIQQDNDHAYYFFTHPQVLDCVENNIRAADLVSVSTAPLAEQMARLNPNTVVLPNCVDQSLLDLQLEPFPRPKPEWVTVGYTSSPTHRADFEMVKDELVLTSQRHRNVIYVFIGDNHLFPPGVPAAHVEWLQDIEDYYTCLTFDIGIAPLTRTVFNQSKSHIKALEYAARGIPVVASDEPPYREFVVHGETGWLARQPYQFGRYLRDLIADPEMRREMGEAAKLRAAEFTIQRRWPEWAGAYGLEPPA